MVVFKGFFSIDSSTHIVPDQGEGLGQDFWCQSDTPTRVYNCRGIDKARVNLLCAYLRLMYIYCTLNTGKIP